MPKPVKRRFLTLELNPMMTDAEEKAFKESVAHELGNLSRGPELRALFIPKKCLRMDFKNGIGVDIVIPKNQIIKP